MKSRSYFFVAMLLASVIAIFIVLSIGWKSGEIATKAKTLSTVGETEHPTGDTAVGAPSTSNPSSPSRMIVDAGNAQRSQGGTDEVFPKSRAIPATPLKATVGAKASATLTIGDKKVTLEPNQIGGFPRQLVQQGQKVTVQMSYPAVRRVIWSSLLFSTVANSITVNECCLSTLTLRAG
ncbi:MAG TPA: hypothetical protein VIT91_17195 [Chthoniobacterales bacterium]